MIEKVLLKNMIDALNNCDFKDVNIPIGKDVKGNFVYENYSKMNNIFICGTTSSGKSTFIRNLVTSLTKQLNSDKLELILFDSKQIEFSRLKDKGYIVITDVAESIKICEDLIVEMDRRFGLFVNYNVKNIVEYNSVAQNNKLKHIVVIFDEFGDFIYNDTTIYDSLLKLVQRGRAAGIHFVVSTQCSHLLEREIIKNNIITHMGIDFLNSFTTKIAFLMLSDKDSEFVIKSNDASKLKGNGEAIIVLPDKKYKVQTPFISYDDLTENIRYKY